MKRFLFAILLFAILLFAGTAAPAHSQISAKLAPVEPSNATEVMLKHGIAINDLYAAISPRLAELQNPNDVHFN
jgi:hypothetical protein